MKILLVSQSDHGGGGNKVPYELLCQYRTMGHEAWMAVGNKATDDDAVLTIPKWQRRVSLAFALEAVENWCCRCRARGVRGAWRWVNAIQRVRRWGAEAKWRLGREDMSCPGSRRLLELGSGQPDIVHLHTLHGGYFDLRVLSALSARVPVMITLHDEWLYTGHCAHSIACDRWRTGCGRCPDLVRYPSLGRDGTAANWKRKQRIYVRANLNVTAPCSWLIERARRSMLGACDCRVIPNGVDLGTFRPAERSAARVKLGWPSNQSVLLTIANQVRTSAYKDFPTLEKAMEVLAQTATRPVLCVCLGEGGEPITKGLVKMVFVPYESSPGRVAAYCQGADVFVHVARVDTFPTTVLEAMACGLPVVATRVGGVPEQVVEGETGCLVEPGDATQLAETLFNLFGNAALRAQMSAAGVRRAEALFGVRRQATATLDYYRQAIQDFVKR